MHKLKPNFVFIEILNLGGNMKSLLVLSFRTLVCIRH